MQDECSFWIASPTSNPSLNIFGYSSVQKDDLLYFCGGMRGVVHRSWHELSVLNIKSLSWEEFRTNNKSPGFFNHSTAIYHNKLIVFGGKSSTDKLTKLTNETWCLDLDQREWTKCETTNNPLPSQRHTANIIKDTMIIFGGCAIDMQGFNSIRILDLNTWTWTTLEHFEGIPPSPRYSHGSSVLEDRYLLIAGGLIPPVTIEERNQSKDIVSILELKPPLRYRTKLPADSKTVFLFDTLHQTWIDCGEISIPAGAKCCITSLPSPYQLSIFYCLSLKHELVENRTTTKANSWILFFEGDRMGVIEAPAHKMVHQLHVGVYKDRYIIAFDDESVKETVSQKIWKMNLKMPWKLERILWIGWKDSGSLFHLLPKEVLKLVIYYASFPTATTTTTRSKCLIM